MTNRRVQEPYARWCERRTDGLRAHWPSARFSALFILPSFRFLYFASINELVILSNLENINALLIEQKIAKEERFKQLNRIARTQLTALDGKDFMKSIKRLSEKTYLEKREDMNEE